MLYGEPLSFSWGVFMNQIQRHSFILSIFFLFLTLAAPLYAADNSCSFNAMVTADEFSYRIASNSVDSCNRQILSISVLKNALPFTQFVNPTDYVAETAWAEDIDDDGRFELLIVSHKTDAVDIKSLDIFSVDGNTLKQARLPELLDKSGYRGGDRFSSEGGRIVRIFPFYQPKDKDGKPSGEKRLQYQYRNRQLLLAGATPNQKVQPAAGKAEPMKKGEQLKIISIQTKQDYIEIKTSTSTDKYKVFRISDPWRLVIDFPGAVTDMQDKTVVIGRFGITRARVGLNKGFVRIVFDSATASLQTETVTPAENAVRIGFYPSK